MVNNNSVAVPLNVIKDYVLQHVSKCTLGSNLPTVHVQRTQYTYEV
jgi:hypothetical protein